ncbi:MAG: undecaprenyldiphospho-muramoylpentapeptide beta-N-acetylglucosaminyltransferase [Chitinophagaceae bacterium]|nr:undecaprenyldiphospho-muramoylpentapeptide beta-N-acetylglucosaminyltransferase [Chitinophagaceae bacterium]
MQVNQTKKLNIIIAGGGTGGHIFPAIAIANALKEMHPAIQILFVGAKGKMEMEKVPQAGYQIIGLDIAGFNRSSIIKNLSLPFKLIQSFFQVKEIVKSFEPIAAIGVGGYSSFPVLKYCQAKGINTFIHESNSFAGKSNILLGKKATQVFVASTGMDKFFPSHKIKITGNPVRKNITDSIITKNDAIDFFGLNPDKKTVLIIGGSLGARSINKAILNGLSHFTDNDIQVIWQTGKSDVRSFKALHNVEKGVWVNEFIGAMEMAYAAADVVISRSGAMSVAEICVVQKPVIFVPFPYAAEDHQTVNAKQLVKHQAALMVQDGLAMQQLVKAAVDLVQNESQQQQLKINIAQFSVKNADQQIANSILENIQ